MSKLCGDNHAYFTIYSTQCGRYRVDQLYFSCPKGWKPPIPKSVISKNGTFLCGPRDIQSFLQSIPFVSTQVYTVRKGRLVLTSLSMQLPSYLIAVNGVLYGKAGNIY